MRWLLAADFYFILGHIHQSVVGWNVEELYSRLTALFNSRGFPMGRQLQCPVFVQDKFQYILACNDITILTLKLKMHSDYVNSLHEYSKGDPRTLQTFLMVIAIA
jgi:uncharacterized membrane protein